MQHAHQKGVVHRDLKPANVLVTVVDGSPVPKVIDFGVAKAVAGKLIEGTLSTQFGAVVGTLEYMAPEQAGFAADDVDTRADVYSLGVILYELLTGLLPFDAKCLRGRSRSRRCSASSARRTRRASRRVSPTRRCQRGGRRRAEPRRRSRS